MSIPNTASSTNKWQDYFFQCDQRYIDFWISFAEQNRFQLEKTVDDLENVLKAIEKAYLQNLFEKFATGVICIYTHLITIGRGKEIKKHISNLIPIVPEINDQALSARIFLCHGNYFNETGSLEKSASSFEKALEIARDLDQTITAEILARYGTLAGKLGKLEQTKEMCLEVMSLENDLEDENTLALAYLNLGTVYAFQGEYENAIKSLKTSLFLSDSKSIKALIQLGSIYGNLGNEEKAIKYAKQALKEARDRMNYYDLQSALGFIIAVGINNEPQEIKPLIEEFEFNAIRVGDEASRARSLIQKGTLCLFEGYKEQAESCLSEALKIIEENNYNDWAPSCLGRLGLLHLRRGNYKRAKAFFKKGLSKSQEFKFAEAECGLLLLSGRLAEIEGQMDNSTAAYNKCLEIADKKNIVFHRAISRIYLAEEYMNQSDYINAEKMLERAKNLLGENGRKENICRLNGLWGRLHAIRQDSEKFENYFAKGLEIAHDLNFPWLICELYLHKGIAEFDLRLWQASSDSLLTGLKLGQEAGYPEFEAKFLLQFARVAKQVNRVEPAQKYAQESHAIFKQIGHSQQTVALQFLETYA